MEIHRKRAVIAGVLFIIAAVADIAGLILYGPILNDPDYIIKCSVVKGFNPSAFASGNAPQK